MVSPVVLHTHHHVRLHPLRHLDVPAGRSRPSSRQNQAPGFRGEDEFRSFSLQIHPAYVYIIDVERHVAGDRVRR